MGDLWWHCSGHRRPSFIYHHLWSQQIHGEIFVGIDLHKCKKILIFIQKENRRDNNRLKLLLKGNPKEMDRDKALHEQVQYLTYDENWEFPINRLRMGNLE